LAKSGKKGNCPLTASNAENGQCSNPEIQLLGQGVWLIHGGNALSFLGEAVAVIANDEFFCGQTPLKKYALMIQKPCHFCDRIIGMDNLAIFSKISQNADHSEV
jgi:hypothetical protein